MIRGILVLSILLFINPLARSQKQIEVTNDKLNTDKCQQAAYLVEIPEANLDIVVNAWMKAIRQNTKAKPVRVGTNIGIEGTQIDEIHPAPFNIYSLVYQVGSSIRIVAAWEIDSVFFSPPADDAPHNELQTLGAIKSFMRSFAVEQYKVIVQSQLDNKEDKLQDLNKEYKTLVKENEGLMEDVSENEQNIQNSQDAIATLDNDNARLMADINAKRDAMTGLSGDEALRDEAKDQLKSLEKEKKG